MYWLKPISGKGEGIPKVSVQLCEAVGRDLANTFDCKLVIKDENGNVVKTIYPEPGLPESIFPLRGL